MAKKIIVADDNAIIRKMLRRMFEAQQDYDLCAEAENGQEAIALAIEHRPDIHRPRQFRKPPDRRRRADVLSGARVAGSRMCPVPARVSVAGGLDASQ